jgi:hypothetical protein
MQRFWARGVFLLVFASITVLPAAAKARLAATNVGLAAPRGSTLLVHEDRIVFTVDERTQGGTDLNGDDDVADLILHAFEVETETATNVGLDTSDGFALDERWLAFTVDEGSQGAGGTDFNNDGDVTDLVLHVHNLATGTTTNLGLDASGGFVLDERWLAFAVHEGSQAATDLNGDGDTFDDLVLHVYNLATGTTTNLGLDASGGFVLDERWLAFAVDEDRQVGIDLNGDNDTLDFVLHVVNVKTGRPAFNLGLASNIFDLSKEWLAFTVDERSQGGTHLNDDDDTLDFVLHVFDLETGTTTNVKLDASGGFALGKEWIAFAVRETRQGSTDLNTDGDTSDQVVHMFNMKTGTTTNVGLSMSLFGSFGVGKEWIAFTVDEKGQGETDLNGDGDASDQVVHVIDVKKRHDHQRWPRCLLHFQCGRGSKHHRH